MSVHTTALTDDFVVVGKDGHAENVLRAEACLFVHIDVEAGVLVSICYI